ncbi:hypothetical protein ACWFNS_07535 [Oerskovia enterophila]
MTAPDPGLTDLIAAHAHLPQFMCCSCGDDLWKYPEGGHAAHVALVVEQHTNGRIAELEAAVRKRIQLLREHDGFGAAHADGYMGMNWTAYYEGAYQAQVMAAADLENDLRAALEGEQQ